MPGTNGQAPDGHAADRQGPEAETSEAPAPAPQVLERVERIWFPHFIRGVACLVIVWEHLAHEYLLVPSAVKTLAFTDVNVGLGIRPPAVEIKLYEWLGVLKVSPGLIAIFLFFLVSGFVIPFSLERRTASGFLVRRFFRVYPTLWVALGITLSVLALQAFLTDAAFPFGKKDIAASAGLVAGYVGRPWVDSIYWTLAVEELFYALAVIAVWRGVLHRRSTVLVGALILAGVCLVAVPGGSPAAPSLLWWFRQGLSRNAGFAVVTMIGVLFHEHYQRRWDTRTCLLLGAAVLGAFFAALQGGPFPGNQAGIYFASSVGATLVFGTMYLLRRHVPYVKAIDWVANGSYPLYLLHVVTGMIVMHSLYERIHSFYVVVPLTFAVVLAMAAIVHKVVETPAMNLGRRISSRPRFRLPDHRAPVPPPAPAPVPTAPPVAPGVEIA
ncbi:MAG: hypothetical protein QOE93_1527 [Actinomycetota bacterium]|nr:hypothetical protein [Actinomycetota bacterium]